MGDEEEKEEWPGLGLAERLKAAAKQYHAGLYMVVDESVPEDQQQSPPPTYLSKAKITIQYGLKEKQVER
jgi:hypothetical protein